MKNIVKTILLNISYYGEPFCGFARQPNQLTVQGNVEEALAKIFKREVLTVCAGRTDSGVHARHQYMSFELNTAELEKPNICSLKFIKYLDRLTHVDIHILEAQIIDGEFSARFDAKLRKYSYFIANQNSPALIMDRFSWHVPQKLDIDAMRQAAKLLEGEHDFKSFCVAASAKDKPTCRNIKKIKILERDIFGDNIIEIKIEGNAFLHSMVRTIVGTLLKVGTHHREPD